MRKALLAVAALCPMLIHAQAHSPAQPTSAGASAVLESRLTTPKTPAASVEAPSPVHTPVRVSSGVTFPKLVETEQIVESAEWQWRPTESEKIAVVKLIVDPTGKPSQVQVVQSLGAGMDNDIVAAVSRYRFQPGMLNNQPVPITVNLTVRIVSRLNGFGM